MIIELAAAGAAVAGYLKSKDFTKRKLAFVDAAQTPSAPIVAGVGTAFALALLPVITLFPAAIVGVGIGAGVRAGQRKKLGGG